MDEIFNIFIPKPTGPISAKFGIKHPYEWVIGNNFFFKWRVTLFKGENPGDNNEIANFNFTWQKASFVGLKGLKFVKMNDEIVKIHWQKLKIFFKTVNQSANFTQTWHKTSLGERNVSLFEWRARPAPHPKGDYIKEIAKIHWWNLINPSSPEPMNQFNFNQT